MPLPLAVPIGLLFGLSLAWLARVELARSEVPLLLARPFLIALGFGAIVFGPVIGYSVALHGDWAYLYLVRYARVPSAVDLGLVILAAGSVPLGFAIGAPWALAKRGTPFLRVGAVIGVVLLVATALSLKRLGVSASYAQFHGGFGGNSIAKEPLGRGVLLSWVAIFAGFGWALRALRTPRVL
jgi:hypothetical protein